MFAEGGWRRPEEPQPRRPSITKRQERVLLWVLAVNVLVWLVAPIGGSTVVHAVVALLGP